MVRRSQRVIPQQQSQKVWWKQLERTAYAWFNLMNAMMGVGAFALPVAFKQSGLWMGTALMVILGLANIHSMIKLVKCSQYVSYVKESSESPALSAKGTAATHLSQSSQNTPKGDATSDAAASESEKSENGQDGADRCPRTETTKPLLSKATNSEPMDNPARVQTNATQSDSLKSTQRSTDEDEIPNYVYIRYLQFLPNIGL
ncbi:hypothetical protein COOONC_12003 [Cooperia oncophora]